MVGGEIFLTLCLSVHSSTEFFLHMLGHLASNKYFILCISVSLPTNDRDISYENIYVVSMSTVTMGRLVRYFFITHCTGAEASGQWACMSQKMDRICKIQQLTWVVCIFYYFFLV